MNAAARKTPGQTAYEMDIQQRPTYHDGKQRPSWDALSDIAKWSWGRPVINT